MIEMPPKLWLPPKPAIVRAASLKDVERATKKDSIQYGAGFPLGNSFSPYSGQFDGATELQHTGALGTNAVTVGTVSFWAYLFSYSSTSSKRPVFSSRSSASERWSAHVDGSTSSRKVNMFGQQSSGTNRVLATSAAAYPLNVWHHILMEYRLGAGDAWRVYIDGVQSNHAGATLGGSVDWSQGIWAVGAYTGGASSNWGFWNGYLAELWVAPVYLDITQTATIRKFLNADGTPAYLGQDGTFPGATPVIYCSETDQIPFTTNRGSGGALSIVRGTSVPRGPKPSI